MLFFSYHQLDYCQNETTLSLSHNNTNTNMQQEKHIVYPLKYLQYVYIVSSQQEEHN